MDLMQLIAELMLKYSSEDLSKLATLLDKKYVYSRFFNGWKVLEELVFLPNNIDIEYYKENFLYVDIFDCLLRKFGKNETLIKYFLTKEFISNDNEVGLFEYTVCNSRVDFARVNGSSYAYEIKTELDNTSRLNHQTKDYRKIFEYVYVVVHEKHLSKVRKEVSRNTGIIQYTFEDGIVMFNKLREAKYNKGFQKKELLCTLTSAELSFILKSSGISKIPCSRDKREKLVNRLYNKEELNKSFKDAIKCSKVKRWEFIRENFHDIKAIELQKSYTYN